MAKKLAAQVTPEAETQETEADFVLTAHEVTSDLELGAIAYKQHNTEFFASVWTGAELAANTTVPTFNPKTKAGYQRALKLSKFRKAARHLATGGIFPTGLLLSIRKGDHAKLKRTVVAKVGGVEMLRLVIPKGVVIYIVDGQHRRHAIEEAQNNGVPMDDFRMNANIILAGDELDEALHFRIIHNEQKKVDTTLTDEIILREVEEGRVSVKQLKDLKEHKRARELTATQVVNILRERPDSPWHGKISGGNASLLVDEAEEAGEDAPEWAVTFKSMKVSLKPIVEALPTWSPEEIANIAIAYWRAIIELSKEAWEDEEQYRYLHNTTGINIMHMMFPAVFGESMKEGGPSKANFTKLLERAGIDSDLFKKDGDLKGIGGFGGFKAKASDLQNALAE